LLFPLCSHLRGVRLHGDTGARALLKRARVVEVACDGLGSAADIDTPEDLEALR
jgi:CTP:molybdopterin cytidylyltransferase MocA